MVHEAALQKDTPLENSGFSFFANNATFTSVVQGIEPGIIWGVGNLDAWMSLDEECHNGIRSNNEYWFSYYRGSVDMDVYTSEDFTEMPPTVFQ
jgi:hypothetical protein